MVARCRDGGEPVSFFGDLLSTVFERRYRGASWVEDDGRTIEDLCAGLLSSQGEVSGVALARNILDRYARLDDDGKTAFFTHLLRGLDLEPDRVRQALEAYEGDPSAQTYRALARVTEPSRQELARRLNQVPGATARLVAMRADLLRLKRSHPELGALDVDFRHLFRSWFNRGFLVLRPINWDSPAAILEQIIAYEAVHAIDSWDDLRRRLVPGDRRCYGFFHPSMADEPLIFVEVALTRGIPNSIQRLLTEQRDILADHDADTAVFYSISNCQDGLAGISFGNSLIKQVVEDLSRDLPGLTTFVTLSPIPKLNAWRDANEALSTDPGVAAAHYLLEAKRPDGAPYDPVARFHLGNGARVHAVHGDADMSENGLAQSDGAMVNYLYDRDQIAQNHEQFAGSNIVVASPDVHNLAAKATRGSTS